MPLIHFEYTANLPLEAKIKTFLLETHYVLVEEAEADLLACKSAVEKREQYVIGDGDAQHAFILLRIQLLPGRTEAMRERVGHLLVKKIKQYFAPELAAVTAQVRVYVTEIEKPYYYGLS